MTRMMTLVAAAIAIASVSASAQLRGRDVTNLDASNQGDRGRQPPGKTPKDAAPIDLTGYWVSIVSEDWRFRMLTPPKGDFPNFLLTPDGTKVAQVAPWMMPIYCTAGTTAGTKTMSTNISAILSEITNVSTRRRAFDSSSAS